MEKEDQYPLFPELQEAAQKEAQRLLNKFGEKLKDVAGEIIGNFYANIVPYIESDTWSNFRNQLMDGFKNYNNRKIQFAHDFAEIRKQIFEQFKDEIIKDLNQDMVDEIEKLKKENDQLSKMIDNRYQ